jgi:hypothetical protein
MGWLFPKQVLALALVLDGFMELMEMRKGMGCNEMRCCPVAHSRFMSASWMKRTYPSARLES